MNRAILTSVFLVVSALIGAVRCKQSTMPGIGSLVSTISFDLPGGDSLEFSVPDGWRMVNKGLATSPHKIEMRASMSKQTSNISPGEADLYLKPLLAGAPPENNKQIEFGEFRGISSVELENSGQTNLYFRLCGKRCFVGVLFVSERMMNLKDYLLCEHIVRSIKIHEKPRSSKQVEWVFGGFPLLSDPTSWASSTYDPRGRMTREAFSNGVYNQ